MQLIPPAHVRARVVLHLGSTQQAPGLGATQGFGGGGGGGARAAEGRAGNDAEAVQAEQAAMQQHEAAQQELLSRLLFMIGTFIALCLIFFP
jgi:hypothetical protein